MKQRIESITRFLIRIPTDVWRDVKQWAEEEDRSLNGQVVHILRQAVEERKREKGEGA